MARVIVFHDVEDEQTWANAWRKTAGSRHDLFAKVGVTAQTFRGPDNPNATGLLLDVPDMEAFQALLDSDDGQRAMQEDGVKVATLRILTEFTP